MTMLSAALAQGTTPGAPENLMASTNENSIFLSWSPPMDQGNSSIIAYLIYRGGDSGMGGFYAETQSTSYEDFGIDPGTTYYYQVSARNDDGEGPRSNEVSAMIESPSYTLSGRVRDSDSGDGIDGARLEFVLQGSEPIQMETWTDGSGSYNIDLNEGNYRVRVEADDFETFEDFVNINNIQTKDFELDSKDGGGGSEDFNLSKILHIDEDKIHGFVITAAIIAGAVFSILPLTLIITIIVLIIIFIRLGKIRKELRARNEQDGIFISKRRKRKHDQKAKKPEVKKEEKPKPEEKKKSVEVEEEKEEEEEEED